MMVRQQFFNFTMCESWQLFSFSTSKLLFHCLLASNVAIEKLAVSLIIPFFDGNLFSLATFKIFGLWILAVLKYLGFPLVPVLCFLIYQFMYLIHFGTVSAVNPSTTLCCT